jgi:hypothetical protein
MEGEEVFQSHEEIKYIRFDGESEKLVVVFSGFNGPDAERQQSYNYIRSLKNLNLSKLYILDNHGERGSYYLGKIKHGTVEKSVFELIEFQRNELGITRENVILCGSSKGGSAALYFGLKYGYGEVISGAPQIQIADYLASLDHTQQTLSYITGDEPTLFNKLNNLIENQIIASSGRTELTFFSSHNDWQYKVHLSPFLKKLDDENLTYSLEISDYPSHGQVGTYFGDYLFKTIYKSAFSKDFPESKTVFTKYSDRLTYSTETLEDDLVFAYYFQVDNEIIEKRWYSKDLVGEIQISDLENKNVIVDVFVKDVNGNIMVSKYSL